MYTISERCAISRAYALAAEEHFINARATLIRARARMIAAGILHKAAQEMRLFVALMR